MSRKPVLLLLLCCGVAVVVLLARGGAAQWLDGQVVARPWVEQPAPAEPGAPAPGLEAAYRAAQADPTLSEEDRVRAAVDAYFKLKYESRVQDRALDLGIVIDTSTKEGKALHDYELGRLQYRLLSWRLSSIRFVAFDYRPDYGAVDIQDDTATVRVRPQACFKINSSGTLHVEPTGDQHEVRLTGGPTGWRLVADGYLDEIKNSHPLGTDWAALYASYPQRLAEQRNRWQELANHSRTEEKAEGGEGEPLVVVSYDRDRASWYATTYTVDDGGYGTSGYNPLFYAFGSQDCTNFASPVVWYGFGGRNDATGIHAHLLPMVESQRHASNWYGDEGRRHALAWSVLRNFSRMIADNWQTNSPGPQGYAGGMALASKGDVIIHGDDGHALVVSDIRDYDGDAVADFAEIYVSGHNPNRNNRLLADLLPETECNPLHIVRFRMPWRDVSTAGHWRDGA